VHPAIADTEIIKRIRESCVFTVMPLIHESPHPAFGRPALFKTGANESGVHSAGLATDRREFLSPGEDIFHTVALVIYSGKV
jgi:hypothetical protein